MFFLRFPPYLFTCEKPINRQGKFPGDPRYGCGPPCKAQDPTGPGASIPMDPHGIGILGMVNMALGLPH